MSNLAITVEGGKTKKLLTAGKYCDSDIVVTADASSEDSLVSRSVTAYRNDRVQTVGTSAFQGAAALVSVDFAEATKMSAYCFNNCTKLDSVNIPKVTFVGNGAFAGCSSLETIEIPALTQLYTGAFSNCAKLVQVILRCSAVPTLYGATFTNTPIVNGTGYIYVPDELVDSYKTATNWSAHADQIKPLSELEG